MTAIIPSFLSSNFISLEEGFELKVGRCCRQSTEKSALSNCHSGTKKSVSTKRGMRWKLAVVGKDAMAKVSGSGRDEFDKRAICFAKKKKLKK